MDAANGRIFTVKAIAISAFLGGPLPAGILIARNYRVFGNPDASRNTLFISILATFLLVGGLYWISESTLSKIPQTLLPAIYAPLIGFAAHKLQQKQIQAFLENQGKLASNWIVATYTAIGILLVFGIAFSMVYFGDNNQFKVHHIENTKVAIYYQKKVHKKFTRRVAAIIDKSGLLYQSEGADLYLTDVGDSYILKFVLPTTKALDDDAFLQTFKGFEKYLNENLKPKKPVVIGFTDRNLEVNYPLPKVALKKEFEPLPKLVAYKVSAIHTIYYDEVTPLSDVKLLGQAMERLQGYFPASQTIDLVFQNKGVYYKMQLFLPKEAWTDPIVSGQLKSLQDYLEDSGIYKEVHFTLVDVKRNEEMEWKEAAGENGKKTK